MSTDIKPGQVWKDRDDNARVRVDDTYPTRVGFTWITTGASATRYVDEFLSRFVLDAPAPLDPSKVKAGDTVTLGSDELAANVTGRVTDIQHDHGAWTIYLTLGVMGHSTPFVVGVGTSWTLTAHQPAPEPEPEWAGRFVSAVIDVDTDGRRFERRSGFVSRSSGSEDALYLLGHGDYQTRRNMSEVEDVRPLVVIDPADVDVDALNTAALKAYMDDSSVMTADGVRAAVGAVLAQLGIETTR